MRKKSIIHLLVLMTIVTITLMVSCSGSRAEDGGFVIEGILSDIPDSTRIVVCEDMGTEGNEIAKDTIVNGRFRLVGKTIKEGVRPARIYCYTPKEEFICMSYGSILYLQPNAKIKIRSKDADYSQWEIKSNVPAQKTMNLFLETAREEYSLLHQLHVEHYPVQEAFFAEERLKLPIEEQKRLQNKLEDIRSRMNSVENILYRKSLNLMAKLPVDEVWMKQMYHITWCKDSQVQKVAKELCKRMSAAQKDTDDGKHIMNHFFPGYQVKVGDMVPNIELKDINGKPHRLQELKGKYLLLDFWRQMCQPCVKSIPEMAQIAEQMKDSIEVVSISLDPMDVWKEATEEHGITWHNWNDLQETNGIFSRFNVKGYPTYFLVSPDGKLIGKQVGYSKGILFEFIEKTITEYGQFGE